MKTTKKYTSIRKKPVNIQTIDNYLFEHEFKKKIKSTHIKLCRNVNIDNTKIKKFKYFHSKYIYWRMNDEKKIKKFKNFFIDFQNFIRVKDSRQVRIINSASWIIDVRSDQFFHWLSDALQRVEIIHSKLEHYPVLIPDYYLEKDYIREILKLLKINFITYKKTELLLIKKLYLTSHGAESGNYNEKLLKSLKNKIDLIPKAESRDDKIWISRQSDDKRKISNFKEIKQIITDYGFRIVELESMSFSQQLNIISNSKVLAGIHGAGLAHMLFANKNTKILEVRDKNDNKNNCFFSLASALQMDYFYFKASASGNPYNSNYFVNPKEFENFLKISLN